MPQDWIGPVTKDALARLKARLSKPAGSLDLTIGGSRESRVHAQVDAAKRTAIRAGEQRLDQASQTVQRDHRLAALKGYTRAQLVQAIDRREAAGRANRVQHRQRQDRAPER